MAVKTFSQEIESPVAAERMFRALALDNHNLFPKLLPESFKSIEFVHGNTVAVGSIRQFNFPDGSPFKCAKHRIDEVDVSKFYSKYTIIGGDVLEGRFEYIVNESKFEVKGGGCVCKMTTHVKPLAGTEFNEEGPKTGQEKMKKVFKVVEEYLIANPGAYA